MGVNFFALVMPDLQDGSAFFHGTAFEVGNEGLKLDDGSRIRNEQVDKKGTRSEYGVVMGNIGSIVT